MLARRPVWNHLAKEIPVATRGAQARIRFGTVSPETPRRGAEQRWGRSCKSPVGRLEASTSGLKGVDVVRANGTPWQPNHFQNRQTIAAPTIGPAREADSNDSYRFKTDQPGAEAAIAAAMPVANPGDARNDRADASWARWIDRARPCSRYGRRWPILSRFVARYFSRCGSGGAMIGTCSTISSSTA
jgi:hypothetical protein